MEQEDFDEFIEICKDAETCSRLNEWEEKFLQDFRSKLEQYGLQTFMSDKQAGIMRRIAKEKIYT